MRTDVNVKNETAKIEKTLLCELDYGDYFFLEENECLWIYLGDFSITDDDNAKTVFNAFCFEDGRMDYFRCDTMVRPVKNVDITFSL